MGQASQPNKVLGMLNGDWATDSRILPWLQSATFVMAADGAADRCLRLGRNPDVAIGDHDSLQHSLEDLPQFQVIPDQDTTDCDKLLQQAMDLKVKVMTIVGIEGSRPDHFIASLLSIARQDFAIQIAFESGIGTVVRPGTKVLAKANKIVSLLPLEPCSQVWLTGTKWEIKGEELAANKLVSISNQGEGDFSVQIQSGLALLFVETDAVNWEFFKYE